MTAHLSEAAPRSLSARRDRWRGRVRGLALLVAVGAACTLVAWGNRWYVTTMFWPDAGATSAAEWQWTAERMATAHRTLVTGVVLLVLALALEMLGRRLGRPVRQPGAGSEVEGGVGAGWPPARSGGIPSGHGRPRT